MGGGRKVVKSLEKLQNIGFQAGRGVVLQNIPQRIEQLAAEARAGGHLVLQQSEQLFRSDAEHLHKLGKFLRNALGKSGEHQRTRMGDKETRSGFGNRSGGTQRLQKRLKIGVVTASDIHIGRILTVRPGIRSPDARRVWNVLNLCVVWRDGGPVCIAFLPRNGIGHACNVWHSKAPFP